MYEYGNCDIRNPKKKSKSVLVIIAEEVVDLKKMVWYVSNSLMSLFVQSTSLSFSSPLPPSLSCERTHNYLAMNTKTNIKTFVWVFENSFQLQVYHLDKKDLLGKSGTSH
jgi:hypothetical protein